MGSVNGKEPLVGLLSQTDQERGRLWSMLVHSRSSPANMHTVVQAQARGCAPELEAAAQFKEATVEVEPPFAASQSPMGPSAGSPRS